LADETGHRLYLVELDLHGLSTPQRATVDRALDDAIRREIQQGGQIRCVQRIYAPAEHRCLCLFEATGPDVVRHVHDTAQFPLARVISVVSSAPGERGPLTELSEQRPDDVP
jgi:hypothetical protein